MARDGYRPSTDYRTDSRHPQPNHSPASVYPPSNHSENERLRYRDSSPSQRSRMDAMDGQKSRQPVNDAVSSAVGKAEAADALPPDVLNSITSQITANVLQQLKSTNPEARAPSQNSNRSNTAAATNGVSSVSSVRPPSSPPLDHNNVFTPPSPHRAPDESFCTSPTSPNKFTPAGPGRYSPDEDRRSVSRNSRPSPSDEALNSNFDRPKPPSRQSAEFTTLEKIWGPLFDGSQPTPRLGQFLRGLALHLIEDYEPKRSLVITPAKLQKFYEDTKLKAELYPWQVVFDDRTSSISRLYRDVEAQHHLVQDRFDERPDIPSLTPLGFERWSTLMLLAHPDQEFERLQKAVLDMPICNSDDRRERFPKEISRRLFPAAADQGIREKLRRAMVTRCNISLPDQRLGDPEPNPPHVAQKSNAANRADSMASATSSHPTVHYHTAADSAFSKAPRATSVERERPQPVSTGPSEVAIDEEDDLPVPQPIERERAPYSTQPGGGRGRTFDEVHRSVTPPGTRSSGSHSTAVPSSGSDKLSRSASVASHSGRSTDQAKSQAHPGNAPPFLRHAPTQPAMDTTTSMPDSSSFPRRRANSGLNHFQPSGRPMRRRSPSVNTKVGGEYPHPHQYPPPPPPPTHRTDVDGSLPPHSAYNFHGASPSSGEATDDSRRFRDSERYHPPADRQDQHHRSSMYEIPSRDRDVRSRYQPSTGYNDTSRGHYSSDEDYYRSTGGRSHNGYDTQQYYR